MKLLPCKALGALHLSSTHTPAVQGCTQFLKHRRTALQAPTSHPSTHKAGAALLHEVIWHSLRKNNVAAACENWLHSVLNLCEVRCVIMDAGPKPSLGRKAPRGQNQPCTAQQSAVCLLQAGSVSRGPSSTEQGAPPVIHTVPAVWGSSEASFTQEQLNPPQLSIDLSGSNFSRMPKAPHAAFKQLSQPIPAGSSCSITFPNAS